MAHNLLTDRERILWRALYRDGWRCDRDTTTRKWTVFDERRRIRSGAWWHRDEAVSEALEGTK